MKEIISMYQNLIAKHLANTGIQYELVLKRRIENNEGVVTLILRDNGSSNMKKEMYRTQRTNKSLDMATHSAYNDFLDFLFIQALERVTERHNNDIKMSINALDITELIPTFTSLREFLKVFTTIKESQAFQPRYKIGWTSDEVTEFVAEVGVENSQLISYGVVGSTDIKYYTYLYKPTNALLLIYDTDY